MRESVDRELDRLVPPDSRWPPALHRAIRHSLFAGGKRLRPILCLTAAETFGAPEGLALAPACGFELVHTYSLVHDDLPAMDDAPLRRGAPTAHVVFGEATAILAGDALLTLGLAVLARYPERERFVPLRLAVVSLVADAIGSEGMIGGQIADLEAAGADSPSTSESGFASEERLVEIHDAKTGRLIRAALTAGALYAGATEDSLSRLDDYGRALGLAFQIKDDLLDVEADTATLGKRAGADSAARKLTFPAVRGVEGSRALLAQKVRDAIDAARSLPGGGGRLAELASYVAERSA